MTVALVLHPSGGLSDSWTGCWSRLVEDRLTALETWMAAWPV